MMADFQLVLCLVAVLIRPCFSGQLKKFQSDGRVSRVTVIQTVHSLSECAALFETNRNSNAFNFNKDDNMCELSENYPEGFTEAAEGWKVYARIADGTWSPWMNWEDTCFPTCSGGTRSRSRVCNNSSTSNGGAPCTGMSTEYEGFEGFDRDDYIFGADVLQWSTAKKACEEMSARLVIIESQEEIDFLQIFEQDFKHWIGMTCNAGTNCTWIDGRSIDGGFQAWTQGQPSGSNCVWIGFNGNTWDDDLCYLEKQYICEIL